MESANHQYIKDFSVFVVKQEFIVLNIFLLNFTPQNWELKVQSSFKSFWIFIRALKRPCHSVQQIKQL